MTTAIMFSRQRTLVAAGGGAHRRQGIFPCPGARFSKVPVTIRGSESRFAFPVLASKTKASIILKMIQ